MKMHTPCDERDELTGEYYCPYMDSSGYVDCEYWCHDESDYPSPLLTRNAKPLSMPYLSRSMTTM